MSCFWVIVAALLLQGSMQVYSRKVEYLYTLVLRALEFLSQKMFDFWDKVSAFISLLLCKVHLFTSTFVHGGEVDN